MTSESDRLNSDRRNWLRWGPYLSERAWGTVREDYSADGDAWNFFPHDHARSRVYRWNEDGLGGISDDKQFLCFSLALWNGNDPILKERLFGLTGLEGNHGEDVKECYWYLDATPTHSYMKMLYRYPQRAFPYSELVEENRRRTRSDPEYELTDTHALDDNRYCDVTIEYAKAGPDDICVRITAVNRGESIAPLWLLPTLWFRNTWRWGDDDRVPSIVESHVEGRRGVFSPVLKASHATLGSYALCCEAADELIFTNNETNTARLFGDSGPITYSKDAFHDYVVRRTRAAVNPDRNGTKAAAIYHRELQPGETWTIRLRLMHGGEMPSNEDDIESVFARRISEADAFYASLARGSKKAAPLTDEQSKLQRQALAGMLWSKQFYHYDVQRWLRGDPAQPGPPSERLRGRNHKWAHLNNADIILMPDKWEYPWYASWDLGFHCLPLALIDSEFAKSQLVLLTREWYQHPNGQIPAYEWALGDANPPVMGWAAWRVFKIDRDQRRAVVADDHGDLQFLERVFHKLLLNFTWWVNRQDRDERNVFQGGFLGLDNIGIFDRGATLPTGGHIEQSDGTAWMGMYCLNLMRIALELALSNPVYEDIATKFFEHFLFIAGAMNNIGGDGVALWDDVDAFYYDVLHLNDDTEHPLKIRSMVGLTPLFAIEILPPELLAKLPNFRKRLEWFLKYRPDLANLISRWHEPGVGDTRLVALARGHRLKKLLARVLDPGEFLSDFGVRSLSKIHADHPFTLRVADEVHTIGYEPAESQTGLFGGNSNWRGPVWLPLNYLLVEAIEKYHVYFGDDFRVECPTGSGQLVTLRDVADELRTRLLKLFHADELGNYLFHEYFDGETGKGLGASHQTGWTGLIANLVR